MNDFERWIYLDGPVPAYLEAPMTALRALEAPRPRPEDKARVMADLFATLDARLAQANESAGESVGEEAEESEISTLPRPARGTEGAELPLDFEEWAALSLRLLGAGEEEKLAALSARSLAPEVWEELDEEYLEVLSEDVVEGRSERAEVYSASCAREMARRREAIEIEEEEDTAEEDEEAGAPMPALVQAPEGLRGTLQSFEIPASARGLRKGMPFLDPSEIPAAPAKAVAKTAQVPVWRESVGETLPLGSDAIHKAIAALPFGGSTGGRVVVSFPSLTVQQVVSLRAELLARPDLRAEALRRYGVANEAALRALEDHWREELGRRADLRAEMDAALAVYVGLLRG